MSCEKCGCETAFMEVPHANICECSRCRKVVELKTELEDTVTECLTAKSNEDIMRKQLAKLQELLTLIRDDLRMRSEDGVVDISDFIWMRIDKVLQEKGE